ncbi:hypothetical protein K456DRAFT_48777 [Colletotrichum gloeosporioides 23]|nr:hypothetical protein K456DRAFT_48777 [Colletotrichum gloeosporioides 23]
MWLLNAKNRRLQQCLFPPSSPYAILAHNLSSPGHNEWLAYDTDMRHTIIDNSCRLALENGLEFVWIDAVCIDKTSTASVSEAVNSVWKYLKLATLCFAYLVDLDCKTSDDCEENWRKSCFWKRAWTLQELILPPRVQFFDSCWHLRGERSSSSFPTFLSRITGVDEDVLSNKTTVEDVSIARRMSWAVGREGSYPEDLSYALLGLFGVSMPIIYGEGPASAFRRLQEEVLKVTIDMTILAWTSAHGETHQRGVLAHCVAEFEKFGRTRLASRPFKLEGFAALTSKGVLIQGPCSKKSSHIILDLGSQCSDDYSLDRVGIALEKTSDGTYSRMVSSQIQFLSGYDTTTRLQVMANRGEFDLLNRTTGVLHLPIRDLPGRCQRSEVASCAVDVEDHEWVQVERNHSTDAKSENCHNEMDLAFDSDNDWESASSVHVDTDGISSNVTSSQTPVSPMWMEGATTITPHRQLNLDRPPESLTTKKQLAQFIHRRFRENNRMRHRRLTSTSTHRERPVNLRHHRFLASTKSHELACPFYKHDPSRHIDCLKYFELKTVSDLRRHLRKCHWKPTHCSMCNLHFDSSDERDAHIKLNSCEPRTHQPLDSVSDDQDEDISNTEQVSSLGKQWFRVWDILFCDSEPPKSAWLGTDLELEVSSFRGFYRAVGRDLVENCAQRPDFEEDWDMKFLQSTVFSDVVTRLVNDFLLRSSVRLEYISVS